LAKPALDADFNRFARKKLICNRLESSKPPDFRRASENLFILENPQTMRPPTLRSSATRPAATLTYP
jgi:hypothetical protein